MEYVLWNLCRGILCCGILGVAYLLWIPCLFCVVDSLLWNLSCGIFVVEHLLWNTCCGIVGALFFVVVCVCVCLCVVVCVVVVVVIVVVVAESLYWNLWCGKLWSLCRGILVVDPCLWDICLWYLRCGIFVVESLLLSLCR